MLCGSSNNGFVFIIPPPRYALVPLSQMGQSKCLLRAVLTIVEPASADFRFPFSDFRFPSASLQGGEVYVRCLHVARLTIEEGA